MKKPPRGEGPGGAHDNAEGMADVIPFARPPRVATPEDHDFMEILLEDLQALEALEVVLKSKLESESSLDAPERKKLEEELAEAGVFQLYATSIRTRQEREMHSEEDLQFLSRIFHEFLTYNYMFLFRHLKNEEE